MEKQTLFLLPGPPHEFLPMFHHHVLPVLQQTEHSQKQILKWRIFGLAESEIAQKLEDALSNIDCHTGYRLESPSIEFKVRCYPQLGAQIKKIIAPILAPHIISPVNRKASWLLIDCITNIKEPITIIDEATGGLLQLLLTKPESHHLLNFNGLDKSDLYFHIRGLEDYWQQHSGSGTTQLTIDYRNTTQEGRETHHIPYRSSLVVSYAAEWLCFRLFHLINQLHQ
ncbi:MAG: hypothetical protein ACRCXC_09445 [Legionella sp.]